MPRKPSKKSKALDFFAELAKEQGGTLDISGFTRGEELISTGPEPGQSTREAESVLRSLHKPHAYMMKKCKRKDCGQTFQTNYCATSYCSDTCLAADMRELGLEYDPYRLRRWESMMYSSNSHIVYRYEPPEYISSATLDQLEIYCRKFLEDLDRLRAKAEVVETQKTEENLQRASQILDSLQDGEEDAVETPLSQEKQQETQPHQESSGEEDYDLLTSLFGEPQPLAAIPDLF